MKIYERLLFIIESEFNGSKADFCRRVNVHPSTLHNYVTEEGEKRIKVQFLASLSDTLDINLNWLVTGDGEIFKQDEARKTRSDPLGEKVGEILNNFIHDMKLDKNQLAENLQCTVKELSQIIKGERLLTYSELEALTHLYRINLNTLIARVDIPYLKEQEIKNPECPYFSEVEASIPDSPVVPIQDTYTAKLRPYMLTEDGELAILIRRHENAMLQRKIGKRETTERAIDLLNNELRYLPVED